MEESRAARLRADFSAEYGDATLQGSGTLRNISRTGAWIETTAAKPRIARRIRVTAHVGPEYDVYLEGVVTRATAEGFALALENVSEEVLELLTLLR
jgi:hypothetical protein